ncbi:MAG: sugar-transfer associated ATP-grasp domain-containing protein [Bacilli bacterium]
MLNFKDINKKRLNFLAGFIAKKNGVSVTKVKVNMFFNYFRYGIGYTDYMKGDYFNLSSKDKKNFLAKKKFPAIVSYLNDDKFQNIFLDKIIFNKKFKDFIGRNYIDLRENSYDNFKKFVGKKDSFFAKKHNSFGGDGIEKIDNKKNVNLKDVYERLLKNKQFLIEDTIIQHDYLNEINPSVVNNVRLVTLLKDNEVYIIASLLRLNNGDGNVINCQDIFGSLDENGRLVGNMVDDYCHTYEKHPLTGFVFKKMKIPFMNEAIDMVKKAGKVVKEIRYVGWDVAITPNGPIIIEGNFYPSYGLFQYYLLNDGKPVGKIPLIKEILGDEAKNI